MKSELTVIIFLILIQITQIELHQIIKQLKFFIEEKSLESLISSKNINYFQYGNSGVALRDEIYDLLPFGEYFQYCYLGQSISIKLLQKYLLNKLKIWFWDYGYRNNQGIRYYDIIVYAKLDKGKNIIYDSNLAISLMTIEFPDQFVEEFQILNVGGNTYNTVLHIIKVEAYYKFS